ncbi:unnamed protein product [Rotaria sp. Silwood2]|nr:unnamed protein product [Rotaria sp. Silwood2]CAF2953769.1 unnamed protein product [Rotaria sp. Silwood2]CAF3202843.1 unnamed protein product [Rotaria sp. Silwood2]CAF3953497.1 unnamed protein product [Rotaria sp. Silwood2]CAF4047705.1 unnamed protein product [Rotaria sp. Silwood2]
MRTRSQSLVAKRKIQDDLTSLGQVDEELTLANQTTVTTSKRRKKAKALPTEDQIESVVVEKRLHCYRPRPTIAIRVRIQRALSQRLYLLAASSTQAEPLYREYKVFGQTGNVYTVIITHLPSCTCPDHANGYLCKHIIFVLHRVLKVDRRSPLLYQKALLTNELNEIFAKADLQRSGTFNDSNVLAEQEVREAYRVTTGDPDTIFDTVVDVTPTMATTTTATMVQQKPITADDDCPICFESMEDETNDANNEFDRSITCIEYLSNEFFNEIFDHLDGYKICKAFSNLNQGFQNLLNSSSLLFKIDLNNSTYYIYPKSFS